MNICILSAFQNMSSGGRIDRYFDQVLALHSHALKNDPNIHIRVVAVEGDSHDKTNHDLQWKRMLIASRVHVTIISHNHGQGVFGSTEDKSRLSALTNIMKILMSSVNPSDDNVVLYVESDLVWSPHDAGSIIDLAYRRESGYDIISHLIFAGDNFYDVFAYRGLDGERFGPFKPYHSSLQGYTLTEVSSVGSCLAFRAELAAKVVPVGELGLISWCAGARALGYRIAVAPQFKIRHP